MEFIRKTYLSRIWVFTALLFIAAVFNSAYVSVQSNIAILNHINIGDSSAIYSIQSSHCKEYVEECTDHIDIRTESEVPGGLKQSHHHHHTNENPSSIVSEASLGFTSRLVTLVMLHPSEANRLIGRSPSTIDRPPRVMSRLS